ncbi:hypothetical protein WA026_016065 [Henosepilachna vigintioctopunctata]|uniref:SET domain-containing protein n=1 Tax=Henosepilachna vigintioctopunctata TaxID=420089 RepID=A0AAW1U8T6_9CUCU
MSVCLENNNVLASQVGTTSASQNPNQSTIENVITTISSSSNSVPSVEVNDPQQQALPAKSVTKLLVSNHQNSVGGSAAPVLQKINPVITVLNSAGGPLTVLKTICVTSGVSSAPHFSLVNNQPLTVTNAVGKTPTITLLNAPVTVVKVPSQTQSDKSLDASNSSVNTQNINTIIENRAHNVFVKNTCLDSSITEVPQSHKFLTANSFPQTNVIPTVAPVSGKTVNGQRNKLKIISTVAVPSTSNTQQPPNLVLNKTNTQQQRLVPRPKVLGANGNQTKYISKLPNSTQKSSHYNLKQVTDKTAAQQSRIMYPTHKSQIKTIPPVNNYIPKVQGIKTITPLQPKNIPGQVQRTGSGLRTIPPQRPPKLPNKLNYIGKHAVQAQKVKSSGGLNRYNKNVKQSSIPPYNNYMQPLHTNKQLAFNQALTAEILETLSNKSTPTTSYSSKNYEILPNRFEGPVYTDQKLQEPVKFEDKSKSGLDALSLICQAVLLDHNYNATLPPESPTRATAIPNAPSQMNGMSGNSMLLYSPGASTKNKYPQERKRTLSCSNPVSSNSSTSNLSSIIPSNSTSLVNMQEDDAASDISDCSDRKHDTEGEETDTAPEAEAVANEESYDHYGDYVTRCICGYLHDDGYMVECDQCKVWQHVQCVLKNKQVPDEYLCEKCNPLKPVDSHKAKSIQQQWLRERQQLPEMKSFKKENKLKEPFKQKDIVTDTDSSDAENPRHNNNTVGPKARTTHAHRKKTEKQMGRQKKDIKESNSPRKTFKKRERKLVRRKNKLQVKNTEEETHDTFSSTQLPQLRQWIDNYEEAVTNHYSPELRARISNIRVNGAHISDTSTPFDPSVNKCRVHAQPLTDLKYLVATVNVPPNTPVIELRGKYMLSTQHRNAGGNLTTRQHAQRPGPFLFFYRLHKDNTEVCVDTRTYGNNARFVRRSCKPNAELRHCIEKGVLHLYIVTITSIDKNAELTIKHESHDLAVVGTTHIACYCGKLDECNLNKTVKKNGDSSSEVQRKRRGRRTTSASVNSEPETPPVKLIEEPLSSVPPPPPLLPLSQSSIKVEPECEKVVVKIEVEKEDILENKEHIQLTEIKSEPIEIKEERPETPIDVKDPPSTSEIPDIKEKEVKEEKECRKSISGLSTRRTSQHKLEKDKEDDNQVIPKVLTSKQEKIKSKKLSREERKLEAILRAIEQMEKADQRKQEHKQTKHVQRRESEPSPHSKDDEKPSEPKQKRRRRKGRSRTISTHSVRRDRLNSGDSYFTSGDENMLSPNDGIHAKKPEESTDDSTSEKQEGLLLALAGNDDLSKGEKSPVRETDSNSNSAHSSPETPLSLACSLVQAAVEPLESGFKFPKTKKVLMNEWLNKTPDSLPPISSPLSPHINNTELDTSTGFYTPTKNTPSVGNNIINETGPRKRWLRQAISEDKCDSPQESPPLSNSVAPPKKRRLPRESISNDNTPPTTPTSLVPASNTYEETVPQEGCVEIVYSGAECDDNHIEILESDAVLKERAAEMKQEFSQCIVPASVSEVAQRPDTLTFGCLMDPRLRNHHPIFTNSEHLVGTVEKTLSILGFEDRKPEAITPAKRKLSITEYRQRKKLNNNETNDKSDEMCISEDLANDENNSSESLKMSCRQRLNSTSSSCSISSDDELATLPELSSKVPSFNSEPTELERQRELQSLRLKKAFGLSIDVESRKPALDVEAILNCDLPTIHAIKPNISLGSPSFLTSGNCEPTDLIKSTSNSPCVNSIVSQSASPNSSSGDNKENLKEECDSVVPISYTENLHTEVEEIPSTDKEMVQENDVLVLPQEPKTENMDIDADKDEDTEMVEDIKPHLFYTPDEEEEEIRGKTFPDIESINYVPPFNNPIYPSTNYTSVIDEDARYEGRNPSPPPHLESVDSET